METRLDNTASGQPETIVTIHSGQSDAASQLDSVITQLRDKVASGAQWSLVLAKGEYGTQKLALDFASATEAQRTAGGIERITETAAEGTSR